MLGKNIVIANAIPIALFMRKLIGQTETATVDVSKQ